MPEQAVVENTDFTLVQDDFCQEWRDLCFTLELAQGKDLAASCRDRFEFANAWQQFGRDLEKLIVEIRSRAAQGNYSFFTERGIPGRVMTPGVASRMLAAWRDAVASKRNHAALAFNCKYGVAVEAFLRDPNHAEPLARAKRLIESDALLVLEKWTREPAAELSGDVHAAIAATVSEQLAQHDKTLTHLRHEIRRLQDEIGQLRAAVGGATV